MRLFLYSVMCLWAFLLTSSCKDKKTEVEVLEELKQEQEQSQAEAIANDPTKKTIHEIETSYNLEGKTVTLEGFLVPGLVSVVNSNEKFSLHLYDKKGRGGNSLISLSVVFGKKANNIYFPEKFSLKDVEIYDYNGTILSTSDKLKIKATVTYDAKGPIAKPKKPEFNKNIPESVKKIRMDLYEKELERHEKKVAEGDGNDYSVTLDVVSIEKL